ncbi:MAG: hypothetical protein AB8B50_19225 [Pirellulaceae bacterium]
MSDPENSSRPGGSRCLQVRTVVIFLMAVSTVAAQQDEPGPKLSLRFRIDTLEIPAVEFEAFTRGWKVVGATSSKVQLNPSQRKQGVYPASFTFPSSGYQIKTFSELDATQVERLLKEYSRAAKPEVLQNGEKTEIRFGESKQFTLAYEPETDEKGEPTGRMLPRTSTIQEGLSLQLNGQLVNEGQTLRLGIDYYLRAIQRVSDFSYTTANGEFTVQQPSISNSKLNTTCILGASQIFALCGGPATRRVETRSSVPIVGKLPVLGKLFKKTTRASENYYIVFLVRCQLPDA